MGSVGWLDIALEMPIAVVDKSVTMSLEGCDKRLLVVTEFNRNVDEGTCSVSSIVFVANSGDEIAGGADVEEIRIEDAMSDDVSVSTAAEVPGILAVMMVVDSGPVLKDSTIEWEAEDEIGVGDSIGVDALEGTAETAGLVVDKLTTSDERLILELSC